jgi:hypothetical protein
LHAVTTISSNVISRAFATMASSSGACWSNGETLPPDGLAAKSPVSSKRLRHLIAELALISKCSAVSRRDAPPQPSQSPVREGR